MRELQPIDPDIAAFDDANDDSNEVAPSPPPILKTTALDLIALSKRLVYVNRVSDVHVDNVETESNREIPRSLLNVSSQILLALSLELWQVF